MSFWTAAVIIAAIIGFVEIQKSRHAARAARHDSGPVALADDSEVRRELNDLRERIKVLEKITVEGREARAIADEIERLRDN